MWRESNEELKENSEFEIQKNRRFFESVKIIKALEAYH